MKLSLAEFIRGAVDAGLVRYVLVRKAGEELARGVLGGDSAELLEALAREDAVPLDREKAHEYVLTATSEDGVKLQRYAVRVPGGTGVGEGHAVDPERTTTSGAAMGHLTRLCIDQGKALVSLATALATSGQAERTALRHELEQTKRTALRAGKWEVQSQVVAAYAEQAKREAEQGKFFTADVVKEIVAFGKPVLARMLGPAGHKTALEQVKASLTPVQRGELIEKLGPELACELLVLTEPGEVLDFLDKLGGALGQALVGVLSDAQKQMLGGALAEEAAKRNAAKAAKNGQPTQGAPS